MWNKWIFLLHQDWTPPDAALLGDPHSPVSSRAPKFTHHQVLLQYNLLLRNTQHQHESTILGSDCRVMLWWLDSISSVHRFEPFQSKIRSCDSIEMGTQLKVCFWAADGLGFFPNHTWYSQFSSTDTIKVQFFFTQNRANRDKTNFATKQRKLRHN